MGPPVKNLVFQETGDSQGPTHFWPAECNRLSRLGQTIQTEWSLFPEIFRLICTSWHQPEVDLFATRFNNKSPQFVTSFRPFSLGGGCPQSVLGGSGPVFTKILRTFLRIIIKSKKSLSQEFSSISPIHKIIRSKE